MVGFKRPTIGVSFIPDTFWAGGLKVVGAFLALAINGILARVLDPGALGQYFLCSSAATLGLVAGSLGAHPWIIREVARGESSDGLNSSKIISGGLRLCVLGTFAVGGIYASQVMWSWFPDGIASALDGRYFFVWLWGGAIAYQQVNSSYLRGKRLIRISSTYDGIYRDSVATGAILLAALGLGSIFSSNLGLKEVVFCATVSALLAAALSRRSVFGVTKIPRTRHRLGLLRNIFPNLGDTRNLLISTTGPFLVVALVEFVGIHGDLWLAATFLNSEELALIGAATKLCAVMTLAPAVAVVVLGPVIAEAYTGNKEKDKPLVTKIRAGTAACVLVAVLTYAMYIVFGDTILAFVFGDYYRGGYPLLLIMGAVNVMICAMCMAASILAMTGNERILMYIMACSALAQIGFGILGAAIGGVTGLVGATGTVRVVRVVLLLAAARRLTGISALPGGVRLIKSLSIVR